MASARNFNTRYYAFCGGTAGIGQAAAFALAEKGANIAVVGRTKDLGDRTVEALLSKGASSATFIKGDLSTVAGAQATAQSIQAWSPRLDGLVHSAMTAFSEKIVTSDGLEFAFALQYFARVIIDSLLLDHLAASKDGRIVHLAGAVPKSVMPDLDDLQFETHSFSFWKSVLGTHNLGFMFLQEAATRWRNRPVSLNMICVPSTKTKSMSDPNMPLLMRILGWFGTKPEIAAKNVVTFLEASSIGEADRFGVMYDPKKLKVSHPGMDEEKAAKLWSITYNLAKEKGVELGAMSS